MSQAPPRPNPARCALARSIGLAAFVYGYPLVESMRTCRLQTRGATASVIGASRPTIDRPLHWAGPTTADDRDVVTPANDLMYTTAWINLADGPRLLGVPAAASQPGRYFVLALYDAYTENFENLGARNCRAEGETVVLVGPKGVAPELLPPGQRVVRAPTDLVWLIARVLVVDADDLPRAKELQSTITLAALPGSDHGHRPAAVEQWQGEPVDVMAAVLERGEAHEPVAARFFANLCRALADEPGRIEDRGLVAWFAQAGLKPGDGFDCACLDEALREGLLQGFLDGVELVASATRHRQAKPWVLPMRNGRYGSDYLMRALVAYIGLGALVADEALYAAGHFDADGQPLSGAHRYSMRFAPGELPPVDAFWSVTLYGADRYLFPNPIDRHAIGDRTRGLKPDADGGITIGFSHEPPRDTANWLPTPDGPFYLILRLYHPRDGVHGWRIPPLQRAVS